MNAPAPLPIGIRAILKDAAKVRAEHAKLRKGRAIAKAAKIKPLLSIKRVGGMTFVRIGPLVVSFCLSF